MQEYGIVKKVDKNMMTVSVRRSSACGESCASCSAGCKMKENEIVVSNNINAEKGDMVMLEMPSKAVIKSAFLVYILPLITLILGYYIASLFTPSEIKAIISGFIFLAITFVILHIVDKKSKVNIIATKIINKSN